MRPGAVMSARLDPASAVTLKRFLLRVGLLGTFAVLLSRRPGGSFVGMIDLPGLKDDQLRRPASTGKGVTSS